MNERIKQLADQAQHIAEHTTPQGLEWLPAFKEMFAELIVRECAEYVDTLLGDVDNPHYPDGEMIKEHFGVEE